MYEPLGLDKKQHSHWQAELDRYEEAYRRYLEQAWDEADAMFKDLASTSPRPALYRVYLARIAELRDASLPADWDGTFTHTTK